MKEESKKKLSLSKKGHRVSEETRRKIGKKSKGRLCSLETKEKHRIGSTGKQHTTRTKQKIREIRTGKKHREDSKIKMSLSHTGRRTVSGVKHHNWKGGVVLLQKKIRADMIYRRWRSDIFTRDNFICQWCGQKGGVLNADHIKEFHIILEENRIKNIEDALTCEELWNLNNGRTLCRTCHIKHHSKS